jgi:hypothetical protein
MGDISCPRYVVLETSLFYRTRLMVEKSGRSLAKRVNTFVQELLTPLTKTLLILALVLLLTSSICLKYAGQALDLMGFFIL